MSDPRLRELERRFLSSGLAEDEGTFLRERLRAGQTSEVGLRFASVLGSAGAALALEGLGLEPPQPAAELGLWVHTLPGVAVSGPYLLEVGQRVGAALAFVAQEELPGHAEAQAASRFMDAWIVSRREEERRGALQAADRLALQHQNLGRLSRWVTKRRQHKAARSLEQALWPARWPEIHVNGGPAEAAERLASLVGAGPLRSRIAADLVPWALGLGSRGWRRVDFLRRGRGSLGPLFRERVLR